MKYKNSRRNWLNYFQGLDGCHITQEAIEDLLATKPVKEKIVERFCSNCIYDGTINKICVSCVCHTKWKPIKATTKQDKPVDVGENTSCAECGQQLCYCPERQQDGSWKYNSPPKEIKPVDWPTKTWDKRMLRKYNKKVDKLIARMVRETQRIKGEMAEEIKPIKKIIDIDAYKDNDALLGAMVRRINSLISHIIALEER